MASLVNPSVPSSYQMEGPLAGFYAAQQMEDWMGAQDRSFRDSDLADLIRRNEYENALKDNPVKDLERQLKTAQGTDMMGAWNSGEMAQIAAQERQTKLAAAIQGKSDAELKVIQNKATLAQDAAAQLGDPAQMNPMTAAQWETITEPMRKAGMNVSKTYSAAEHQRVMQAARAGIQTIKYIQERQMKEMEIDAQNARQGEANKTQLEVARIHAGAGAADRQASRENAMAIARMNNPGNAAIADLKEKTAKGEPLTEADLNEAMSVTKQTSQIKESDKQAAANKLATAYQADAASREAKAKELGLPKTATAIQIANKEVDLEEAQIYVSKIKTTLPNAKFQRGDKVLPIRELTYKDVPNLADMADSTPTISTQTSTPNGGPIQVKSVEEALALPKGTVFKTPDGKTKVR